MIYWFEGKRHRKLHPKVSKSVSQQVDLTQIRRADDVDSSGASRFGQRGTSVYINPTNKCSPVWLSIDTAIFADFRTSVSI